MTTEIPFFDLEAVAREDIPKEALPQYKPHAGIKDSEKQDKREIGFYEKLKDKMTVDPFYARIVCGAFWIGDMSISTVNDEEEILRTFWRVVEESQGRIGGFNIKGYDLPLIFTRSIQLGIKSSRLIPIKKYGDNITDMMYILCGGDLAKAKSLQAYSSLFGIGVKCGKATDVPDMVANEEWDVLEEYCRHDAWLARELYNKCNYYFM